jgi:tRNA uridine 5-carboxymethylaminomethyl modification enzyme
MLTARAEYRLRLRADNAEARLTPLAIAAGCASAERTSRFAADREERDRIEKLIVPHLPELDPSVLLQRASGLAGRNARILGEAIEDHRYAPYVERQRAEIARMRADESVRIPADLDYDMVAGLSREMAERLKLARPSTLGAAARIRGITPAALAAILVHSRRKAA